MKMSANENESVDIRFFANRLTNLIDIEEINRMERPSRIFSSHHQIPMSPILSDTNNMDQNEQFRRSRDYPTYFETRVGANTSNGDAIRNRSPFVRFTITDPETHQITAAGQIPLNSSPTNNQTNALTNNPEAINVPINDESDDEPFLRHYIEQRRLVDQFNAIVHAPQHSRSSRSGRRSRRFTEHPFFIRNNLENNPSNARTHNRRVRFSSTNRGFNDPPLERSQTPEQELPEILEQDMELEAPDFDESYHRLENMSSLSSSQNDTDSGDDRSMSFSVTENQNSIADEENRDNLDVSNETPRIRVVPFIMSPIPFSPRADSPPNTAAAAAAAAATTAAADTPAISTNNSTPSAPVPLDDDDNNHNVVVIGHETRVAEETVLVRAEEHPETYDELNDQLIRLFECPVCFEHIVPPIFQCLLGHLICNKCVLMCENCPTCRNPFNSKRNLYMEKVGYLVKFPCRNALTGCKEQMFIGQKELHEKECCYRHYQCFFTNCAWKGYYPELPVHMLNNHSISILNGENQFLDIFLPNNNQTYKWFLMAHGEYFAVIAHASIPPRRVKIQVNFIGPAVKAKQYKFTIILTQSKERSNMAQKLMYERLTLPYSEIYEMSNNNSQKKDIFSFPGEVLEPYIKKRHRRLPIILSVDPVVL